MISLTSAQLQLLAPNARSSHRKALAEADAVLAVPGTADCNGFADRHSIRKATKAINGGHIGLASREDWLVKAKSVWH